jgi:hypothetical protein
MSASHDPHSASRTSHVAEVRYSLPRLLEELKQERAASTFAMEKLDQHEIGKLFKSKSTRRAKPQK